MVDKIVDYKGSHEDLFLWNQNVLSIFVNQIVFHLSSFD